MKKNVIIFVSGMVFAGLVGVILLGGRMGIPIPGKWLVKKVITKFQDRKFNTTPKPTKELVLCDFENDSDIDKWQLRDSAVELVDKYKTSGSNAAKVTLKTGGGASSIKMGDYFKRTGAIKDWAGYQSVAFDIYNPQGGQERLILQVKDKNGKSVKQDFSIDGNSQATGEVEIATLRHALDIYDIGDFTIFMWKPGEDKIFYIDNVRLIPYGGNEKRNIFSEDLIESRDAAYATGDYFDFSKNRAKWLKTDTDGKEHVEFPIYLINDVVLPLSNMPFSGGVPFPRGELKDPSNVEIVDVQGARVDFQARPLCRWDDGSVKWLLVDLKKDVAAKHAEGLKLHYSYNIKTQAKESELNVSEDDRQITVNTGLLKFIVTKNGFNLFDKVWVNDELISQDNDITIQFKGRIYKSSLDKDCIVKMEENGPVKATIKAEGWFKNDKGDKFCKYVVRIQAFAGSGIVRVYHTFIYTGYPENKYHYLYKGKRLPANETIEDISINMPVNLTADSTISFGAQREIFQKPWTETIDLVQNSFNKYTIEEAGNTISNGEKLDGWADISDKGKGFAFEIRNLWQQFPKQFSLDRKSSRVIISLWPARAGELDLKTTAGALGPEDVARGSAFGVAKTHELLFNFHKGSYDEAQIKTFAYGVAQPLVIRIDPRWTSDTVVLGKVSPYDSRLGPAEKCLDDLFAWGKNQKESYNWYGMMDFGDTLSWYRKDAYDESYDEWGWHPVGRWGWFNCEATGAHFGPLIQYLRTGKRSYFDFGEDLAIHIMDVDTCHYNTVANDKRLKGIFDDYSQPGSMHRHSADHWSGRNEETTHTNIAGIMLYYYITGYERALDVAKETGDFFLRDPMTYFQHPDIAPQRGLGNLIWGQIQLYEVTRDPKYKTSADKWVNILYQGQHNNGSWTENYNPVEKRWDKDPCTNFMVDYTMPALIEYHMQTRNKAVKESIIKATQYLMKNEEYKHMFDALAYSYWLTGDVKFRDEGARRLDRLLGSQNHTEDPMTNGMIYQKAYFARFAEFLPRVPYIFEVLNAKTQKQKTE